MWNSNNARESRKAEICKLDSALGRLIQILGDQEDRISRLESILAEREGRRIRDERERDPATGIDLHRWIRDRDALRWLAELKEREGFSPDIQDWLPEEVAYTVREFHREFRDGGGGRR
jgi:hypothetical protein